MPIFFSRIISWWKIRKNTKHNRALFNLCIRREHTGIFFGMCLSISISYSHVIAITRPLYPWLVTTSPEGHAREGRFPVPVPSLRAWFLLNIWGFFLGWEELHNFGHSWYLRFHPGSLWIPALGFCWHMVINQFHPVWDWFRSKLEFLFDMFARYFNTIIKLFVIIGVLKQYLYDEQQMFTKQQINKPWIRER